MRLKYIVLCLILFCINTAAKASFVMDATSSAAYKAIFELRFNEARRLVQEEKTKIPDNGIIILLEDDLDYMHLLVTGSRADYTKLKDHRSERIDLIRDNNDKNSPYYLFVQAEIYIHWGIMKATFGDYFSSLTDLNKARKILIENNEKFRDFTPNQKSQAWVDLLLGAIPPGIKSIVGIFGIKGDMTAGHNKLERVRKEMIGTKYAFYNDELVFVICVSETDLLHTRNNYEKLMGLIDSMDDRSLLRRYLQGYVAYKSGHAEEAIKYLTSLPQGSDYATVATINYWLGCAKLCRLDNDADDYLLKFLKENQSSNGIKDTYLRLAYFSLLKNDQANYTKYIQAVRTQGAANQEKDKQALKEANDSKPDLDLLRARFYFDGGYYTNSLNVLKKQDVADLKIIRDITEYYYRLGRAYDKLNNVPEALVNYQKAINIGRGTSYYYSSNAALFSGTLYEQKHEYKKAADYYNLTLQMKNHEFQGSTDAQARDGLSRIKAD